MDQIQQPQQQQQQQQQPQPQEPQQQGLQVQFVNPQGGYEAQQPPEPENNNNGGGNDGQAPPPGQQKSITLIKGTEIARTVEGRCRCAVCKELFGGFEDKEKAPVYMECGHSSICMECFKKGGKKCPVCGKVLNGNKNKKIAEIAGPIKKAREEEERNAEVKRAAAEQEKAAEAAYEQAKGSNEALIREIEEENAQGKNAEENIAQFAEGIESNKHKKEEAERTLDAMKKEATDTAKMQDEEVDREKKLREDIRRLSADIEQKDADIREEEAAATRASEAERPRQEQLKKDDEEVLAQIKAKEAAIQARKNRNKNKTIVPLDLSFIDKAKEALDREEAEATAKDQQGAWSQVLNGTVGYMKGLWSWGSGDKELDVETVLESYDFFEELGDTRTGLFRARLKEDKGGNKMNTVVRRVGLNKKLGPSVASVKGVRTVELSKFNELYIMHHASRLKGGEIARVAKYIVPESSATPSASYQWSRSCVNDNNDEYAFFYSVALKPFRGNEAIDLEYLARSGVIDPAVHGPSILAQLLRAVSYLKSLGVAHRDINTGNIFLRGELTNEACPVALAGLSQATSLTENAVLVPLKAHTRFHPPECFQEAPISWIKADLWSVGCSVAEACSRGDPLFSIPELRSLLAEGTLDEKREFVDRKLSKMGKATPQCKAVIKRLLEPNPADRGSSLKSLLMLEPDATIEEASDPAPFDKETLECFVEVLFSGGCLPEK